MRHFRPLALAAALVAAVAVAACSTGDAPTAPATPAAPKVAPARALGDTTQHINGTNSFGETCRNGTFVGSSGFVECLP